jgi:hypothetical protein
MKKTSTILALTLFMAGNTTMYAQFGMKKLVPGKTNAAAENPAQTAVNNDELLRIVTAASDWGMTALDQLALAFPDDKVAEFKAISEKYHTGQAKRTNGNVDAEQIKMCSDAVESMSKLQGDWELYRKEKKDAVLKADARLGAMLGLDTVAATKIPAAIQALQASASSLGSNPLQTGKIKQIKNQIQLFTIIGQQIPVQKNAIANVRSITKNIAQAEKMTLPPDAEPSKVADSVKTKSTLSELN